MAASMGSKDRMTIPAPQRLAQVLRQHVAKEGALLDGVVESDVRVRVLIEPVPGHSVLGAFAIVLFQNCHGVSLRCPKR